MLKQFAFIVALLIICIICSCNHISNIFTPEKTVSYYNNEVISANKFAAIKKALNKGVKEFQAQSGTFILMDATNSVILATYTTDDRSVITEETYDVGAILKVFTVAMGLESGKIKADDKIDTSEPFVVGKLKVTDPHGSHELFELDRIIVESSNIGSAKIITKVGGRYQYGFFKRLGLLSRINSNNIYSVNPIFIPKEKWVNDEIYVTTLSFGYGLSATPLHIITAYSAIINGGTYHKPTFEKMVNNYGIYVISEENSELMRKYLRETVTDGTARRANSDKYVLMGKTSTVDKFGKDGKYDHDKVISTFVGNFEHNGIEYAILVMLDDPKASKETYGYVTAGWNAVPIAGKIIEEIVK